MWMQQVAMNRNIENRRPNMQDRGKTSAVQKWKKECAGNQERKNENCDTPISQPLRMHSDEPGCDDDVDDDDRGESITYCHRHHRHGGEKPHRWPASPHLEGCLP